MVNVNDIVLHKNKSYMVKELKDDKAFCVGYAYKDGLFVSTKGEVEIVNDDTIKKLTDLELKAREFENDIEKLNEDAKKEDKETEEPKAKKVK